MASRKKSSQSKTGQKKPTKKSPSPSKTTKTRPETSTRKLPKSSGSSKTSRVVLLDLTEQEPAKTWQQEQKIWMGGVLDATMDAIITVDEQQQIVLFNQGAAEMFRCPSAEAIGTSIDQFIPKRFRTIHHDHVRRFIQSGDTVRSMKKFSNLLGLRSNGEEFPMESSISKFKLSGKKLLTVIVRDITERRKSEAALEKEQQFIAKILDTAGALVIVLDPNWRIVQFNRMCEKLTGRTIEEMRGKSFLDLSVVSGEDAQEVKSLLSSFKERQFPEFFESAWIDRDRKLRWIRWSNTVIKDKEGKAENIIATGIDITERKQVEQALQENTNFLQSVLQSTDEGIISLNSQGIVVLWNKGAETLFGISSDEMVGHSLTRIIPGRFRQAHQDGIKRAALAGRQTVEGEMFELMGLRKDGNEFPLELSLGYWKKAGQTFFTGIVRDITERKQAEQAVLESQIKIEGIIRTAIDAIISVDINQQIVVFNPAAESMFGCTKEEAIGKSLERFLPARFRKVHRRNVREFGQSRATPRAMGRLGMVYGLRANGEEFPIEASISKVGVGKNKLFTVILRDVTARLQAEQTLQRSEERLDLALKGANLGVWDWNRQTGEVHHDEQWLAMLGHMVDELEPTFESWDQRLHPEDKPWVIKTLQDHLDGLTPFYQTEYRLRTKTGKWKWVLDTGKVVSRDPKGKPLRITGTHQDITVRKEAERDLSKEREFISAVLETAGGLVVVFDRQGRIVRFNRACEELTGYSFKEVQDKPLWDLLLPPEEIPAVKKVFRGLRQGALANQFENHWVTKDRKTRRIAWSNTTLANEQGEVEYVIGTGIDITERRKAEEEINRLLNQNALILASVEEGIYGIAVDGRTIFFNRAAEQLTGWTGQEVQGQALHPLLHHTKPDGTPYPWEECPAYSSLTHGNVHFVDIEVLWRKDGTSFPVEYTSTPILDEGRQIKGAVVTFRDISERHRNENLLQGQKQILEMISVEKSLTEVFEKICRFVEQLDRGAICSIFLYDGMALRVGAAPSLPTSYVQALEGMLSSPQAGSCGTAAYKKEQVIVSDIATDPLWKRYRKLASEHGLRACWSTPILSKSNTVLGVLGIYHRQPQNPETNDFALMDLACNLAGLAIERHVAQTRLQTSREELQALGGKLISAQEDERRRISRELHDDMNQRLAVLALNIQSAQKEFAESAPMYQTLQKLYDEVSLLSDDVRHLAYQLHPSILDDLGLKVALQSFVDDFSKWEGIPVTFVSADLPVSLPQEVASCLYRVTQECLRNVTRHAQATQVDVKLIEEDGALRLFVKDNGKGFKVEETRSGKVGLGLIGMQERVRVVQGIFEVKSVPSQGTEITVWVPIPKAGSS